MVGLIIQEKEVKTYHIRIKTTILKGKEKNITKTWKFAQYSESRVGLDTVE